MEELKVLKNHVMELMIHLGTVDKTLLKTSNNQIWGQFKAVKRRTKSDQGSDITVFQDKNKETREKHYCGSGKTFEFVANKPHYRDTPINDFIINIDINLSELTEKQIYISEAGDKFLKLTLAVKKNGNGLRCYQYIDKQTIHLGRVYIHFFRQNVSDMKSVNMDQISKLNNLWGVEEQAKQEAHKDEDDLPF